MIHPAVSAAPLPPDDQSIRVAAKARLAEASGDARSALNALVDLAATAPDRPELAARTLDQALIVGDLRRATDASRRLWDAGEQRFDARLVLLVDALRRNDLPMAKVFAGEAPGKAGIDLSARLISPVVLGWLGAARGEDSPERFLARMGRQGADPTPQWIGASLTLFGGNIEAAKRQAESLVPANRTSQLVAARLAASLAARGQPSAAAAIRAQLARFPDPDAQMLARERFRPITDVRQGIAQWFGLLGDGFVRAPNGSRDLALLFSRAAHWLDPADPVAQLALAEALLELEQGDIALALLERSEGGLPIGNQISLRRAEVLSARGNHAEAIAAALPGNAELPADTGWLTRFADVARAARNDRVAAAVFDRLLALLPADPDNSPLRSAVLIARAELLLRENRWPEARSLMEAAVAANPNDPGTLNYVGYSSLERRDNVPLALRRIEAAWQQDRRNAAITDSLGWAYFLTGDIERAVPLLEQAARGEPDNAVINEHLGDALWKSGRMIEARYAWRVAALSAEPEMAARLAAKLVDGLTDATLAP